MQLINYFLIPQSFSSKKYVWHVEIHINVALKLHQVLTLEIHLYPDDFIRPVDKAEPLL